MALSQEWVPVLVLVVLAIRLVLALVALPVLLAVLATLRLALALVVQRVICQGRD